MTTFSRRSSSATAPDFHRISCGTALFVADFRSVGIQLDVQFKTYSARRGRVTLIQLDHTGRFTCHAVARQFARFTVALTVFDKHFQPLVDDVEIGGEPVSADSGVITPAALQRIVKTSAA